ncbi:hypothetical protein SAMN05216320_107251 [Duganella sp. OV458]|nr:hypothetical protein SAMN05216320_107251 [Duganella sp. OV458]SDK11407.1 hypothetical protein SAMN05428973_108252 [Duganella sp. OV510]
MQRGEAEALFQLSSAVKHLQEVGYRPRLACHLAKLATVLNLKGQRDAGLELVEHALSLCDAGQERGCQAEMLRIKGMLLEPVDEAAAEALYRRSIEVAESQGALSWQLRTMNNLSRLMTRQGHAADGRRLLLDVYNQFDEGFDTSDLPEARALLDQPSAG